MKSRGYVDLHSVSLNSATSIHPNKVSAGSLKSDVVFDEIKKFVRDEQETAKRANAVFAYVITKDGSTVAEWTVDLKKLSVYKGKPEGIKADATITISDDDMADMAVGKLDPQAAFMKGKLKITGNIMVADKMRLILKGKSKL